MSLLTDTREGLPTTTFYVTIASNQPGGMGCYEIHATSQDHARALAFKYCPDGRWSFLYKTLEEVHALDRRRHGVITSDGVRFGG